MIFFENLCFFSYYHGIFWERGNIALRGGGVKFPVILKITPPPSSILKNCAFDSFFIIFAKQKQKGNKNCQKSNCRESRMPINLKRDYATKVCWGGGIFQGRPNKSNLIYITQKLYCPTPNLPILPDLPILGGGWGVGNPVFQKTG